MKTLIRNPDFPKSVRKARLAWVAETLRNKVLQVPTTVVGVRTKFLERVKR